MSFPKGRHLDSIAYSRKTSYDSGLHCAIRRSTDNLSGNPIGKGVRWITRAFTASIVSNINDFAGKDHFGDCHCTATMKLENWPYYRLQ